MVDLDLIEAAVVVPELVAVPEVAEHDETCKIIIHLNCYVVCKSSSNCPALAAAGDLMPHFIQGV